MTFTVITASAGSGKTYTLTTRLADALAGGVRTSEIIATTFTAIGATLTIRGAGADKVTTDP